MTSFPLIIFFLIGFAVTFAGIPLIRRFSGGTGSREGCFHATHKNPISRLGGLAFAASFVAAGLGVILYRPESITQQPMLITFIASSLAMFALGFFDDLRPLGAKKKLIAQVGIAAAAYYGGIRIESFELPVFGGHIEFGSFAGVITVLWLVSFTNLINLIDGIDGLAAGIGLMLMGLLVVVGMGANAASFTVLCAAVMAGSQLAFLRFNFPPAKIYMGDGGAYFLGFLIGSMTVLNSQKGTVVAAMIAPLFALALPIIDVSVAIVRRGLKGLPIFRADRRHIHHRLMARGFSRQKTVLTLYCISLVCLIFAFTVFLSRGQWLPFIFGIFCLTLLFAGHCIDFHRDFQALGRVLGNSVQLRKDTRYALALIKCLELEAERSETVEELWPDFVALCRKFQFQRVTLTGTDSKKEWQTSISANPENGAPLTTSYDMPHRSFSSIEFSACSSTIDERSFDLLTELAAEGWLKAVNRWQAVNDQPAEIIFPKASNSFRLQDLPHPRPFSKASA